MAMEEDQQRSAIITYTLIQIFRIESISAARDSAVVPDSTRREKTTGPRIPHGDLVSNTDSTLWATSAGPVNEHVWNTRLFTPLCPLTHEENPELEFS